MCMIDIYKARYGTSLSWESVNFSFLKGKTIVEIDGMNLDSVSVVFRTDENEIFRMLHHEDCCETVEIIDIVGSEEDLLNTPILLAEEVYDSEDKEESYGWTFYKLATIKGYVDIRWLGYHNGYYSVGISFERLTT